MNSSQHFRISIAMMTLLSFLVSSQILVAQVQVVDADDKTESQADESLPKDEIGIRFGKSFTTDWQFGLRVNAKLNSKGISAFFPIPRNWPEQEVEVVEETKSDRIDKLTYKKPTKWTEQIEFSIPRMNAGQVEQAVIHVRVKKKMIEAPKDTSQFAIPKKVRGQLRNFLRPSPYIESRDKRIRSIAEELRDESLPAWDQVEKNYRWVRKNVAYKFDPVIQTCLTALNKKHGDCEELSSLFIAICRCQGVPARAVWIPDHTYPEFYLVDKTGDGHWFPCQAAGTYAFGSMPESRPILQKGDRFKNPQSGMPGQPKEVRYISPSLKASPGSNLAIQFIRRPMVLEKGIKQAESANNPR